MNRILGIASVGLSSLALGVALWGPGKAETPVVQQEAPRVQDHTADVRMLQTRVKALEETVQLLSRRMLAFEQGGGTAAAGSGVPAAGLEAEVARLREEMRGMMVGGAMNTEAGRQSMKDLMRTVQEEQRTEQRQQWQQQIDDMRAQADTERANRVKSFISDARLSYSQEQTLTKLLQVEDAKRQEMAALTNGVGTRNPREIRREIGETRKQTDQEMQKVLSADQLTKYQQMRQDDMNPRGGGPRGSPVVGGGSGGWETRGSAVGGR
jgi:polyhydroxyalkanoate synthesis regulator phasin